MNGTGILWERSLSLILLIQRGLLVNMSNGTAGEGSSLSMILYEVAALEVFRLEVHLPEECRLTKSVDTGECQVERGATCTYHSRSAVTSIGVRSSKVSMGPSIGTSMSWNVLDDLVLCSRRTQHGLSAHQIEALLCESARGVSSSEVAC